VRPLVLEPNLPATFYRGSGQLARFRSRDDLERRPEDWIASVTARFGHDPDGRTVLPDGSPLADAITADPLAWLGAEHVARYGPDPALLVKLLDPGQRLPVHVHPDRAFARAHLSSGYGKSEAWVVLEAAHDAAVHLGFRRDIRADELARWVSTQDVAALLDATNRVPVEPGDAIFCPAGLPHAIGPDLLLVDVQEPTDFSVLLEWEGFPLDPADALLGLSFDDALSCVDRAACDPAALRGGRAGSDRSLLPAASRPFFLAERLEAGTLDPGYGVLVISAGSGTLSGEWGVLDVARGDTVLVPFAAGACHIAGEVAGVRCRPAPA
jgi:mannose-6-phosphate isomerase